MLRLVVWNSEGKKWDTLWNYYVSPLVMPQQTDDVVALLVESGWAPWVTPGEITLNDPYWLTQGVSYYNGVAARKSTFCVAVEAERRRKALWIPWVKNLDAKPNTRCSMGGMFLPAKMRMGQIDRIMVEGLIRPVVRVTIGTSGNRNTTPEFTILLVHMVSGYPNYAQRQLYELIASMRNLIPESTSAIIVGDMNVNLLTRNFELPEKWRFLSVGGQTQQKGGELDYGILYDPNGVLGGATANVVEQWGTGNNDSDHSVLQYNIPL